MEPIRIFTTFSGYDSQCLALKYAGIPYELVGWSEINRHSIAAHDALFPEAKDLNYGDVSKIDWASVPDFDFLTYSSPCTDISSAGKQMGLTRGSGTRSSLLWEIEKAIEIKKPKYLMMENVKALVSRKFMGDFVKWLDRLDELGYKSYYEVLNGIDFGVPQNRERVFVISIREDIDQRFSFPKPQEIDRFLCDVLEDEVDEKFYLNDDKVREIISKTIEMDNGKQGEDKDKEGSAGVQVEPERMGVLL